MKGKYKWLLCLILASFLVTAVSAQKITVWTWYDAGLGQILRDLVKNEFTPRTGIEVEIVTVPIGDMTNKLLLAYLGGDAPDVVELYSNTVVDLGIRGALLNLNTFPDVNEVKADFNPMLLPALQYKSALYAIPGEVNWTWTYYRADILSDIGVEAPVTWDDVKELSIKLKAREMDIYYYYQGDPSALIVGKYLPFSFQRGTDIYSADGTASTLDSPENIEAFKELTSLHTDYKLPLEDTIYTTFVNGKTPVQILQNWYYHAFEVTAPHLAGMWNISLFPGTKQRDGSIDHTNTGKMLVWSIVSSSKQKEAAWEFVKFINSSETTVKWMNRAYESNDKARLFFSNMNSIEHAVFPEEHIALAITALETCRMQTAVIGGNIANRYVDFAFNKVVLQGDDPEAAIKQAAKESTLEIQKKLKEFDRFIKDL
ncbi:MAG: ABC transporter substrate-binding protein [Bacillota bacterium]|nr:extracellular solute-binding protein [Bacillota bacterium]HOA91263.1 extracellular solute-binding protein [Bacillota bacterium]HPQ11354.1 extracellular solute-binding protein [Bacillota bacterium]HPT60502.1 extracellular solute-binding protein [Bacillota bacterium]HPZ73249.1 extracellular solute-binding protein [Bacillota bacterium]